MTAPQAQPADASSDVAPSSTPSSPQRLTTLIGAVELAARLSEAPEAYFVCDCRFDLSAPTAGSDAYAASHIPGAHFLDLEKVLSGPKNGRNGRHPLPPRQALVDALKSRGLRRDQQVIAYDAHGGMFAARLWWLMRWLGHDRVAVLDGGLPAWVAAGYSVDAAAAPVEPGEFEATKALMTTVDVTEVEANLQTRKRLLIDARAADRYRGENETLDPVGGHIPGATNRFFKDNLGPDGRFKRPDALRGEFTKLLGNVPVESVILQCGSGVTACHNALALEMAGLGGAALYPGSWSEWCADSTRPVATGALP